MLPSKHAHTSSNSNTGKYEAYTLNLVPQNLEHSHATLSLLQTCRPEGNLEPHAPLNVHDGMEPEFSHAGVVREVSVKKR